MRASRVGSLTERFFKRFSVNPETQCWEWSGRKNARGYGLIGGEINGKRYAEKGIAILAHRASWIIHHGEIPKGEGAHGTVVMHVCDNPMCVNPEHLRLGTQSENVLDMIRKGRRKVRAVSGTEHWHSSFKNQEDIELICATKGRTKELAKQYGVDVSVIKRIRSRNGKGSAEPEKYNRKELSLEVIEHIRSTPPGTRGLTKLYGLSKTAIANIRKGKTYKEPAWTTS